MYLSFLYLDHPTDGGHRGEDVSVTEVSQLTDETFKVGVHCVTGTEASGPSEAITAGQGHDKTCRGWPER